MSDPALSDPAMRKPVRVPAAEIPGMNALLTLAVGVVVVAGLYLAREVLIPITLAVLLSFLLAPVVSLLHRLYIGRVASVVLAMLLAIGLILTAGGLIGTQVAGLAANASQYQDTVEHKVEAVRAMTLGRLSAVMQRVGQNMQQAKPAAAASRSTPAGTTKPVPVEVQQPGPSPFDVARQVLGNVLSPLGTLAIVLVVATFIMLQREDLRDRMIRLFGSGDLHRTTVAMNDAAARLGRYFLSQLGVNAAFGLVIGGGLAVIGVPSAPLWGMVGLLLRFVPYVGPWLAAAVPLLLAAAVEPGWSMLAWTAALYAGTEFVMGQAVEPMLYGHSTGLSPFAVVVAATFWTWLWGPIGLILSTPLTLCLVVLGRHVDRLEFLDVLLGDRPALTPVESFYQRMLAGDPDEAHDQAEALLRERALTTYYDEVAIPGLQLAANDALRGVLTEAQLVRVRAAAANLIAELDTHDDRDPRPPDPDAEEEASLAEQAVPRTPPPGAEAPALSGTVLCLSGRGPLDDAAASIMAQLLAKHGAAARTAPYAAASRDAVATLDLDGVAVVCIAYLELVATPPHLRYLIRRLRQRVPGLCVVAGLWAVNDPVLLDERARSGLGVDHCVGSLRAAVEACVAALQAQPQQAAPTLAAAAA